MHFPTDSAAQTTAFDGPVVDHWLEEKITQISVASIVQGRHDDWNLHRWRGRDVAQAVKRSAVKVWILLYGGSIQHGGCICNVL